MSFLDQLAGSISKVTKNIGDKAQELTDTAKLNGKINDANNLIKSTYAAIGEAYYKLHKDDAEDEMADQMKIITEALKEIEENRSQINAIKGVVVCQVCGAEAAKGSSFCPSCGAKIVAPEPEQAVEEPAGPTCVKCGAVLKEGDVFCTSCGAPVLTDLDETQE